MTWQWRLVNRRLNAHGAATTGPLSLDALGGTVWVLRAWDTTEPAGVEPVVSLAYDVEARFLEQLGGARRVGFLLGRLAISYVSGNGATGVMLFDASTEGTGRAQKTASAKLEAMASRQH